MEPLGPSQYRPYYNPSSTPYLSGHTELLDTPASDSIYDLLDSASLWDASMVILQTQSTNYLSTCIAQPFENAKILLQCQLIPKGLTAHENVEEAEEEDDEAEPDYFSENYSQRQEERRTTDSRGYIVQNDGDEPTRPPWQIAPKLPPTLGSVMDAIWTSEGWAGSFKATNLSFIYDVAKAILEGQISGLLSVLVGIPDPILALDTGDAASLFVNVASACLAALLLAPLDIARTKIILTPLSEPRGIWYTLRTLPSRLCPPSLVPVTLLERAIPALMQHSLQSVFDPISSLIQLSVQLPLETILHRAQVAYSPPRKSVVHLGAYTGILGTPWWITRQEGDGLAGLYRGWKAGVWGVVGVWTLGLVTAGQDGRRTGTEF